MQRAFCLTLLTLLLCSSLFAADLRIAAASDLQNVLPDIAKAYEKQTGNKLILTFGASGTLYAQIKNGAPFDVFLSADLSYTQRLIDEKLADASLSARYADGKLVLWVKKALEAQVRNEGIRILNSDNVQKFVIANPEHAPYGRAAQAAIEKLGIFQVVKSKMVMSENIAQAAQFASSGNVDAAFLSASSSSRPGLTANGVIFPLPDDAYPTVEQSGTVLAVARDRKTATQFMAFLLGPESRQILRGYGFYMPEPVLPCTLTSWSGQCAPFEKMFQNPQPAPPPTPRKP